MIDTKPVIVFGIIVNEKTGRSILKWASDYEEEVFDTITDLYLSPIDGINGGDFVFGKQIKLAAGDVFSLYELSDMRFDSELDYYIELLTQEGILNEWDWKPNIHFANLIF